jgi:hypothetical protein
MPVSPTKQTPSRIRDRGGQPSLRPLRKSQRQQILDLLISADGAEVPASELARISLQYGARISELREAGFVIINRIDASNGVKHGFFRLCTGATLPLRLDLERDGVR